MKLKAILLMPTIAFFCVFTIWPIGEVIWLSFYKTNFVISAFVGLDNYKTVFKDIDFLISIGNSFLYSMILIPGQVCMSVLCSLLIYKLNKKWQDISRVLFYIPVLSSGIIIAQVWKWGFNINGPINWFLNLFGIENIIWFAQSTTGIPAIAFIVVISSFGLNVILLMASILEIDKSILEAAEIDGASLSQKNKFIVIPSIINTIKVISILSAVGAFQIYETILLLCPFPYMATMTFRIYTTAFKYSKYGMGSVEAIVLIFIIGILLFIQRKLQNEKE